MANCDELQSEARNICEIAADKPDSIDLTNQSIVSEVLIKSGPFAGQTTNRIKLGPFLKPECVKDLLPSLNGFPDTPSLPPYIFSPAEFRCHWVKDTSKPTSGWTTCHDTTDWFMRLSSRHNKWKSQRIYEFLKLSTYPSLPFDGVLSASLLSCWNPCLNAFITGQGPMTVTLEDIAYITGLSPSGLELPYHKHIQGALDTSQILFRRHYDNKITSNLSFSTFTSKYNLIRDKEVTREEEILFINFAICKMLMGPSINVYRTFLPLAANIEAYPEDQPLALGPFLLAQLYRSMYKMRTSGSLMHTGGPLWLLTMWGFLYFPSLVSIKTREEIEDEMSEGLGIYPSSACCYGEVAISLMRTPSTKKVQEVLPKLLDPSPSAGSKTVNWHPCSAKDEMNAPLYDFSSWAKTAAPEWLLETSPIMYKTEDSAHWRSILVPRDLLYVGPQSIGVEVYNPNLAARQFGMIQACPLPFYQTQNQPWGKRLEFARGGIRKNAKEELDRKWAIETSVSSKGTFTITNFNVQPWFCSADVDAGFEIWWTDFTKRHLAGKTFTTFQEKIFKALGEEYRLESNPLALSQNLAEPQSDTVDEEVPSSAKVAGDSMKGIASPSIFRSRRAKKRVSASYPQPLKKQSKQTTEKKPRDKEVVEEDEDAILLSQFKRKKKATSKPTPPSSVRTDVASGASGEDRLSDSMSLSTLSSFEEAVPIATLQKCSNPVAQRTPLISEESIEANGHCSMPLESLETSGHLDSSGPIDVTPRPLDARFIQEVPKICHLSKDDEAPDSVKACGKLSARIESVLKTLSHPPLPGISLLEIKKTYLLDTLQKLVKDSENFEDFPSLIMQAQEFAELAPACFLSTVDHLKKSVDSIRDLSSKLKDQGPTILSSLEKKPKLASSMERLKLEVEDKIEGVNTLRKTHSDLSTKIEALEAELAQLRGERDAIEEQLVDADDELSSVSRRLNESITAFENEAAQLARVESLRMDWDRDMKVFKSAIVGIIEQLRSL